MKEKDLQIPWSDIEDKLETLSSVEGGNSDARRGIITLLNNQKVFIKIGVNDHTKAWASKEIKAYAFLAEHSYPYIPKFLSKNEEENGFAIEALTREEGWNWSDTWDGPRLEATLKAMDALADIRPSSAYTELLKPVLSEEDNGWIKLEASEEQKANLLGKLETVGKAHAGEDISTQAKKSKDFRMQFDTLVHFDVRADNCAWNKSKELVRLVDWNWLQLGDRHLDLAAMLTHVHKGGFNVLEKYSERLDAGALHWMAGFWFEAASKPIWPGGPAKLRDTQLQAGITALDLANQVN